MRPPETVQEHLASWEGEQEDDTNNMEHIIEWLNSDDGHEWMREERRHHIQCEMKTYANKAERLSTIVFKRAYGGGLSWKLKAHRRNRPSVDKRMPGYGHYVSMLHCSWHASSATERLMYGKHCISQRLGEPYRRRKHNRLPNVMSASGRALPTRLHWSF